MVESLQSGLMLTALSSLEGRPLLSTINIKKFFRQQLCFSSSCPLCVPESVSNYPYGSIGVHFPEAAAIFIPGMTFPLQTLLPEESKDQRHPRHGEVSGWISNYAVRAEWGGLGGRKPFQMDGWRAGHTGASSVIILLLSCRRGRAGGGGCWWYGR